MNIKELETFLQFLRKKELDENILTEIFRNNLIDPSKFHFESYFRAKSVEKYSLENKAIQCLQNWRNVYGRFGINNSLSHIDVSFQVGTGSGRIESWDSTLGGLTFGVSLGKNNFMNDQVASPSNNYTYSGTYTYTLNYLLFFEGIGEIWTSDTYQVRVRVDACSGEVSYTLVQP